MLGFYHVCPEFDKQLTSVEECEAALEILGLSFTPGHYSGITVYDPVDEDFVSSCSFVEDRDYVLGYFNDLAPLMVYGKGKKQTMPICRGCKFVIFYMYKKTLVEIIPD